MTIRYEIRGVTRDDIEELLVLAEHLDSVNLPHSRDELVALVEHSEQSFSHKIRDAKKRTYTFILRDLVEKRPVGTSTIFAQLGRRDAPYIYFDVRTEERYSSTLDRHFVHQVLEIGYSYNGPTEIGGLVTHPDYRRSIDRLGMQISYVRFLFVAMHRADFKDELLAELMPPLEPDGTSHLWEAVGHKFTGLSYKEADRLSHRNKEFIRGLFPDGSIYASLLPEKAQAVIGQVGPQTKGVEKLLRRIGFRYANRVDPFDGGPHFVASTDRVELIERSAQVRVAAGDVGAGRRALVARELDSSPWFRAVATQVEVEGDQATVRPDVAEHLALEPGQAAWLLPLD